ncbi:unnamed protein product [Protopolystoma xenopodis]|uniref:Phosphoenolpyruvate carboxykinase C-terminal P-loop domain-containing protein n=1 Tax=Protopolystoma xenopodis TaxID=117903 RepID=A0A448WWM1_9PLAT|nr:unnamed protein product [Protopolystoma xenopodis]
MYHILSLFDSFENRPGLKLPKIFHVNWFRKDSHSGKFLWPGFGENMRVIDWILRRIDGDVEARKTSIGLLPHLNDINLSGLSQRPDMEQLFQLSSEFLHREIADIRRYFEDQLSQDLPTPIAQELEEFEKRVNTMSC